MVDPKTVVQPLYNHTSQETSYKVDGYSYGFRLKCSIRYWFERSDKKGFRFCSQTTNPKHSYESWNKPKKSTYMLLAACMFLDDKGHVVWTGISEYSSAQEVLDFIQIFPQADLSNLLPWCLGKKVLRMKIIKGQAVYSINKIAQEPSLIEKEEAQKDLAIYEQCIELLKGPKP